MEADTEEQKQGTGPLSAPSCSAWTEKPPEKAGWYWIRFAGVEARPVKVEHNGVTFEYYISGMGKFSLFYPPSHFVEFAACEPPNDKLTDAAPPSGIETKTDATGRRSRAATC